jgi:hypothetical protein
MQMSKNRGIGPTNALNTATTISDRASTILSQNKDEGRSYQTADCVDWIPIFYIVGRN